MPLEPDALERLFRHLAETVDVTAPEARARLLAKAFLLLSQAHGDAAAAMRALDEARATNR